MSTFELPRLFVLWRYSTSVLSVWTSCRAVFNSELKLPFNPRHNVAGIQNGGCHQTVLCDMTGLIICMHILILKKKTMSIWSEHICMVFIAPNTNFGFVYKIMLCQTHTSPNGYYRLRVFIIIIGKSFSQTGYTINIYIWHPPCGNNKWDLVGYFEWYFI